MSEFLGEHEYEPVRGLPAHLPPGETMLWQGVPSWRKFAMHVFHVRAIAVYFALIALWRLTVGINDGVPFGVIAQGMGVVALMAAVVIGLLCGYAVMLARSTVYTITDRRVVIRGGITMPKSWNLPFSRIRSAAMRSERDGSGDLSLELEAGNRIAYLLLWPFAKPWCLREPQPLLRGLADVRRPAEVLSRALTNATRGRAAAGDRVDARSPLGATAADRGAGIGVAVG